MKRLTDTGFDEKDIVHFGNKYITGNGYIGCRGTLDEFGKAEFVGLNVAGVYDGVPGKWRESVNVFNPLYMSLNCNGEVLDVRNKNMRKHKISLDISTGEFSRTTLFCIDGGNVRLETARSVSYAHKAQIFSRTKITSDCDVNLMITVAVDPEVWELNGPHYRDICKGGGEHYLKVKAVTQELGIPVSVECRYSSPLIPMADDSFGHIHVALKKDEEFVLDRVANVLVDDDVPLWQSYDEAKVAHLAAWKAVWNRSRVKIYGDSHADFALAYSIYHLLILAPKGDYSIAARGLSGQTYKGAVFWDTEIFMLLFYLAVLPECARGLIKYRIDTLHEAIKKAKSYGYGGAFYAWESQNGYDACSDFNVTDVFTHRPVRTYFRDKQIHISADVAYAILMYYSRTGDDELMLKGGLKTVLMCAEFGRTYSYFNHIKGRYELLDVIGPDEYHERVNNNAYTNYMFWKAATDGVACAVSLSRKYPREYAAIIEELPQNIIENLRSWAENLYLPAPGSDGVIEQFDGYFSLEDVTVDEVRSRLVDPREYWGGSGGVATATRVIKQADVIMLFNLYPDLFPVEVQRANYNFYSRYTEHGSSLSRCSYALTACRTGMADQAYSDFLRSAETDLLGKSKQWAGEVYIGGTHPAASGGAWQTAVCGFCGLKYSGNIPKVSPILPKQINKISFKAYDGSGYCTFNINRGVMKND